MCGATITIPGGAGTPYVTVGKSPRARRTGFYHRVGAPRAQSSDPSLCPAPIAYAAATSEGVGYSPGPGLYGAPASIMLPWPRWFLPIVPGAAFALSQSYAARLIMERPIVPARREKFSRWREIQPLESRSKGLREAMLPSHQHLRR